MMNNISRGKLYKLLSLLFLYPDNSKIEKICRYIHICKDDQEVSTLLNDGLTEVERLFCKDSIKPSDLRLTYTKLFITYHPTLICPPYLHVYLDLNPVEIQYTLNKLLKNLRLRVDEGFRDLKDHISLLLELLYYLTLIENREMAEDIERRVLKDFIFTWIDKFAECLMENGEYYSKVGSLLKKSFNYIKILLT